VPGSLGGGSEGGAVRGARRGGRHLLREVEHSCCWQVRPFLSHMVCDLDLTLPGFGLILAVGLGLEEEGGLGEEGVLDGREEEVGVHIHLEEGGVGVGRHSARQHHVLRCCALQPQQTCEG